MKIANDGGNEISAGKPMGEKGKKTWEKGRGENENKKTKARKEVPFVFSSPSPLGFEKSSPTDPLFSSPSLYFALPTTVR